MNRLARDDGAQGGHGHDQEAVDLRVAAIRSGHRDVPVACSCRAVDGDTGRYLRVVIHGEAVDGYPRAEAHQGGAGEVVAGDGHILRLTLDALTGVHRCYRRWRLVDVKPLVKVAVPAALVTETSLAPTVADPLTVMLAVIWVLLSTVKLLTVIPEPKPTVVTPRKLVPVRVTLSACP